jgi:hypothetical protein
VDLSYNAIGSISPLSSLDPTEGGFSGIGLYIDLSGNKITDISPLPTSFTKAEGYRYLFLDGNPITDFTHAGEFEVAVFSFTYKDGIDLSPFKETKKYGGLGQAFYVTDAPLGKQVEIEAALKGSDMNTGLAFVSTEEIKAVKQQRSAQDFQTATDSQTATPTSGASQ